ncbi:hypothetical protein Dimus_014712 [Dionaea muscipula]
MPGWLLSVENCTHGTVAERGPNAAKLASSQNCRATSIDKWIDFSARSDFASSLGGPFVRWPPIFTQLHCPLLAWRGRAGCPPCMGLSSMHVQRSPEEKDHVAAARPCTSSARCSLTMESPVLAVQAATVRHWSSAGGSLLAVHCSLKPAAGGDHCPPMHGFAARCHGGGSTARGQGDGSAARPGKDHRSLVWLPAGGGEDHCSPDAHCSVMGGSCSSSPPLLDGHHRAPLLAEERATVRPMLAACDHGSCSAARPGKGHCPLYTTSRHPVLGCSLEEEPTARWRRLPANEEAHCSPVGGNPRPLLASRSPLR